MKFECLAIVSNHLMDHLMDTLIVFLEFDDYGARAW